MNELEIDKQTEIANIYLNAQFQIFQNLNCLDSDF